MMTKLIAIAIVVFTALLVVSHLRNLAQDTLLAIHKTAFRVANSDRVVQNLAYAALWVLIFTLAMP